MAKQLRRIVVDIDGTICTTEPNGEYAAKRPIPRIIEKVNRLRAAGVHVIYFTARGTTTGIDWRELTDRRFKTWGVQYDELVFGKPEGDLYIDDRGALPDDDWG